MLAKPASSLRSLMHCKLTMAHVQRAGAGPSRRFPLVSLSQLPVIILTLNGHNRVSSYSSLNQIVEHNGMCKLHPKSFQSLRLYIH